MLIDFIEENGVVGPEPKLPKVHATCPKGYIEDHLTGLASTLYLERLAACVARGGVFDVDQEWKDAIRKAEARLAPAVERTAPGMAQWFELFPPQANS